MPNPKVEEAVLGLRDNLLARLLFASLGENLAEVCAIVSLLSQKDLPPPLLSRLRAIEADLREMGHLCRFLPVSTSLSAPYIRSSSCGRTNDSSGTGKTETL